MKISTEKSDVGDWSLLFDIKEAWTNTLIKEALTNTLKSGYFGEYTGFIWLESDKIPTKYLPETNGPFIVTGLF